MIGYKIVSEVNGEHHSIFAMGCRDVEYKCKKETVPNEGYPPLFVFDTLENARKSGYVSPGTTSIYQCRYKKNNVWLVSEIIGFTKFIPEGTVLADSVTLLKLIR